MKIITYSIALEPNEPFYITPYSDVHFGNNFCNLEGWQKHYAERSKLHNSHFINIGDFNDLVLPNDLKRYKPALQATSEVDDIVNQEIVKSVELIKSQEKAKWIFWGCGNHEDEFLKRHYIDIPKLIAERLNIPVGLYAGVLIITITQKLNKTKDYKGTTRTFTLAYHHGAWGGQEIKGLSGARKYFNAIEGWDVAVFGHNHNAIHDVAPLMQISPRLTLRVKNRHICNCGGWLMQSKEGKDSITYTERHGYVPTATICPVIKVWFERIKDIRELFWEVTY